MVLFTLLATMFLGLVLITSAWSADNPESIHDYIIFKAQREKVPVKEALTIAYCESKKWDANLGKAVLNKDAHNTKGENSVGIFQINLNYHPLTLEEAKNPFLNINYALDLYLKEGWWPWKRCAVLHGLIVPELVSR